MMIGIIGYGMVGKAVAHGFDKIDALISDPAYNNITVYELCNKNPTVIFVCLPTPTDDSNYALIKDVLNQIKDANYTGITVVKSTVLPHHLKDYDVVYNPEFLSRATSLNDFINPPMVIFGGNAEKCAMLSDFYRTYSAVNMTNVKFMDIETASLCKYAMNSFYATKVTFMNIMKELAEKTGADFDILAATLGDHPNIGKSHTLVPGPDGKHGFGGPCLPKDTAALVKEFDIPLLREVLNANDKYRI